ncbi:MAG: putative septum site-determining protein MinC [Caldanaerobacter subterraneus]|jgi:septum site-determining protein MinC|uniref:Probable septum site-determining protein MinC n=4 Tax=Caldanaerobacter subterraneus TaxID=911092 RepID=MINC_CALS4|nr:MULTISPECIES: septum site-determining protein MinC [Caldanaerobacter]Q8RBC0.1 RecName: Full=Probable septum site-determining protein MinC [Caldanaerobacter subterraneus subsp. tengcongensis MB4]AAM24158.1 Septum formation inhibitor [Caldanaerobacter subterraneus subsp. tengcongensis MB4]ERM93016.1 septation inhibitor protein [Caldanaerobacter subterraneus subsp. yonseiensis KB-1]KKC30016.1 septum formation inhibitor [Caldanaerobacter subterraneus subsp. pacificus DSM 12653]KUK09359.1 MAG: p
MVREPVKIQGTKEGLVIVVDEDVDIEVLKERIVDRIEKSLKFFEGATLNVRVKNSKFKDEELEDLKDFILKNYGVEIFIKKFQEKHIKNVTDDEIFNGLEEGITKFHRGTVRSGQVVKYYGNLVIIGDVNPGGLVQAAGNIVVTGTLRGIAHAGFTGNKEAFIVASSLKAMQLRIANIISRAPDKEEEVEYPEIAVVRKNKIIVRPLYHLSDLW